MKSITKSRQVIGQKVFTPCQILNKRNKRIEAQWSITKRLKFLPLAWAGMDKRSFRKIVPPNV